MKKRSTLESKSAISLQSRPEDLQEPNQKCSTPSASRYVCKPVESE